MSKSSSRSGGSVGGGVNNNKVVDESNLKVLRELSHLNRQCFECGQRGPTYVDVTIGSFVCMTCSGLLRGLTPPHRIKSISMATFTSDEIQLLKNRGNEYCRKVWLATYTARDSHLGGEQEKDSDRRNALKSQMSAKYEQKRYYVDPSKIPDLGEIQAQTAKALSSNSTSTSSSMNRSPSLSSASSGSSLTHNAPSPIMNNLRNSTSSTTTSNRLTTSQTLPDIKPLTSLLNSTSSQPINFINNLSSHQVVRNDDKIINTNPKDAWSSGDNNSGFNANFANFDEAFSANSHNSNMGNENVDLFANSNSAKFNEDNGFANFDSACIKPMQPNGYNNSNVNGGSSSGGGGLVMRSGEDRYAALKDLDEIFKHGSDTDAAKNTNGNVGLPNSTSLPQLSSSAGAGSAGYRDWFPTSSPSTNQLHPNPFSIVGTSPPGTNGNAWGGAVGTGSSFSSNNFPPNPFSATPAWNGVASTNGNENHSPFGASQQGFGITSSFAMGNFPSHGKTQFNPFAATTAPTLNLNPHNPFL